MKKIETTSAAVFNQLRGLRSKKQEVTPAELLAMCKQLESALEADGSLRKFTWRKTASVATNLDKKAWRAAARDAEAADTVQLKPVAERADLRLIA